MLESGPAIAAAGAAIESDEDSLPAESRRERDLGPTLGPYTQDELLLLHRHWMWAEQQRGRVRSDRVRSWPDNFDSAHGIMATKAMGFMFVWYGLLWSVIDACTRERTLDLLGPLREDMTCMEPTLRPGRNAILHVPRANDLLDQRMAKLIEDRESPVTIRRIRRRFCRLFLEELASRGRHGHQQHGSR